jgi:hypothetical protein
MLRYQLNQTKSLKLSRLYTIEGDVLVLGNGLIGLLMTYYLTKKNIQCVMIEDGSTYQTAEAYDFDIELYKLSQLIHPKEQEEFFKNVMDTIYEFDAIVEEIGQDCNYERNPTISYKKQSTKGYPLANGLLTYHSGITFDPIRLCERLRSYCMTHGAHIIENACVDTIQLEKQVEIRTLDIQRKIKAKKLIMASSLCDFLVNDNSLYYNEDGIELKLPYIGPLIHYPNIYFNVGNLNLFNGLMGASLISDMYIMDDFNAYQDIKFNCI